MTFSILAASWLRDHAGHLRLKAEAATRAYRHAGPAHEACLFVASKYRAAAVLLDDAATELEDRPPTREDPTK